MYLYLKQFYKHIYTCKFNVSAIRWCRDIVFFVCFARHFNFLFYTVTVYKNQQFAYLKKLYLYIYICLISLS